MLPFTHFFKVLCVCIYIYTVNAHLWNCVLVQKKTWKYLEYWYVIHYLFLISYLLYKQHNENLITTVDHFFFEIPLKLRLYWNTCMYCSVVSLCDPMGYNSPGCSVHGISQARIQEWVSISSSRGSSQPEDRTCISCVGRRILYHWITWEAPVLKHPSS